MVEYQNNINFLTMQKDNSKRMKRDALKSFLEASSTPAASEVTQQDKKQESPQPSRITNQTPQQYDEQYVEEANNCVVCSCELDKVKMKKCGFCIMPACSQHLRKRRRKKGKFQKICDMCEDRVVYEIFSKLQAKAEESLNVEEEIVMMKHQKYFQDVEEKREKRKEIGFRTMKLQGEYEERNSKLEDQENVLMSFERKVQSLGLTVVQLQAFVTRVQTSFKQNYEQDYAILSQQNSREGRQLTKIQKKCQQIRTSMEKKEKEIEEAYSAWEQRQFKNKLEREDRMAVTRASNKKKDCLIY